MKTFKSILLLEVRNLKSFFKTEVVSLYLIQTVFAVILLALVILLVAILD